MLFKKEKSKEEQMYLGCCNVFNLISGNKVRVGEILFKNKKDAEKWMKDIRENYTKDYSGNIGKHWKTVDNLCYEEDGYEYYVVEEKIVTEEGYKIEWSRHELWYRPIKFAKIN